MARGRRGDDMASLAADLSGLPTAWAIIFIFAAVELVFMRLIPGRREYGTDWNLYSPSDLIAHPADDY
jgi:hypothetical protein